MEEDEKSEGEGRRKTDHRRIRLRHRDSSRGVESITSAAENVLCNKLSAEGESVCS